MSLEAKITLTAFMIFVGLLTYFWAAQDSKLYWYDWVGLISLLISGVTTLVCTLILIWR